MGFIEVSGGQLQEGKCGLFGEAAVSMIPALSYWFLAGSREHNRNIVPI